MSATAEIEITEAPTALYRCFAVDGSLLYVGVSGNLCLRFRAHARSSHWWGLADRKTVALFLTRRDALDAETAAIEREQPLHNIARPAPKCIHSARPSCRPVAHLRDLFTQAGLATDGSVAGCLGMDRSTVNRVMHWRQRPSSKFMAQVLAAFPELRFEDLFEVVQRQGGMSAVP